MSYSAQQEALSGFVYLPQDILDWMSRLNVSIKQLDIDVASSTVKTEFKTAWTNFAQRWQKFFEDHQSWFSRWGGSVADETAAYESEYKLWLDGYLKEPGNTGTLAKTPADEHGATEPKELISSITTLVLIGGAVYLAVKIGPELVSKKQSGSRRRS